MPKKAIRPIRVDGDVAYVPLTQGHEAVIDACDADLVSGRHWHAAIRKDRNGTVLRVYAATNAIKDGTRLFTLFMHRLVLPVKDGLFVDHKDGDGLNNRRDNLREADKSENACNSKTRIDSISGFKGVYFWPARGKWRVKIKANGKAKTVGYYQTQAEAIAAYADASAKFHGSFGRTN